MLGWTLPWLNMSPMGTMTESPARGIHLVYTTAKAHLAKGRLLLVASLRTIILNYIYEGFTTSYISLTAYFICLASIAGSVGFIFGMDIYWNPRSFRLNDLVSAFNESLELMLPRYVLLNLAMAFLSGLFVGISTICC